MLAKNGDKVTTIMAIIKYFSDMLSCDSVILLPFGNSDIFAIAKVILYSPLKLCEAQYHSVLAEYHCAAIQLAEGEYN